MEDSERSRSTDFIRGGYTEEEIVQIYELGRLFLENGNFVQAEIVMHGLNEVAPEFSPGWLATAHVHIQHRNFDSAIYATRQALRIQPDFAEALLFLASCLMTTGDYNAAGTYLGEVGERIDTGSIDTPNVIRFFKAQLARYQNR